MADLRTYIDRTGLSAPTLYQICIPIAPLHRAPDPTSMLDTQIIFGHGFEVYKIKDGWAWGQEVCDNTQGYVGYVPLTALVQNRFTPTHCVSVLRALVFTQPSLKSAIRLSLPLNARVQIDGQDGDYRHALDLGWIHKNHIKDVKRSASGNFVEVAELHFGLPYVWGGISSDGLDCSGLVQSALRAVGHEALRDTDMQEATLGASVPITDDLSGLLRGDLVFWKGHVGIMGYANTLLHANAYHMCVGIEPLRTAVDRIAQSAGPITAIKRMDTLLT